MAIAVRRKTLLLLTALLLPTMVLASIAKADEISQGQGPEGWMQFPATWGYCENFNGYDWTYWCYLENDQTWVRVRPDYWQQLAQYGPTG